jgi:hypothetical protein
MRHSAGVGAQAFNAPATGRGARPRVRGQPPVEGSEGTGRLEPAAGAVRWLRFAGRVLVRGDGEARPARG